MSHYIIKIIISALIIVIISEVSKKSSFIGAILTSIPLTSVLSVIWLYNDTKDTELTAELIGSIFWMIIPSLSFFVVFPIMIKNKIGFYFSLSSSLIIMICFYFLTTIILKKLSL